MWYAYTRRPSMSSHSNHSDVSERTEGTDRPNVLTASAAADTREVHVAALRAEADLLRAERGSLESTVDALEAEVASLEAEVASLERALADAEAETERVRRRYEGIIEEKEQAYQQATTDGGTDGPLASARGRVDALTDWLRRRRE